MKLLGPLEYSLLYVGSTAGGPFVWFDYRGRAYRGPRASNYPNLYPGIPAPRAMIWLFGLE